MAAEVGLPASVALLAFADGRHGDVIAVLSPTRRLFHHFGGSHAQRDVLERTLLEAAVRSSSSTLSERLIAERLALRPTGRFALDRRPRLAPRDCAPRIVGRVAAPIVEEKVATQDCVC